MIIFLIFFLILTFTSNTAKIEISEIMYNPLGTDSKHEWIEIYNHGESKVNLSSWKLNEGRVNHHLDLINGSPILNPQQFAVIADNGQIFNSDYLLTNITLFDSSFISGLNNKGEQLILVDGNGTNRFNLTYNASSGANNNGRTICLLNNSWQECLATPGSENQPSPVEEETIVTESSQGEHEDEEENEIVEENENESGEQKKSGENVILTTYLNEEIYTGQIYKKLFKIKVENKNCSKKDNITVSYLITGSDFEKKSLFTKIIGCSTYSSTGEFNPIIAGEYQLCGEVTSSTINESYDLDNSACLNFKVIETLTIPCDIIINLTTDQTLIYEQGQSIKFEPRINHNTYPFIIEYWIDDLFEESVKTRVNTTNTNQKSWKTNIPEKDKVLFVKAYVHPSCNDSNLTNNLAKKMFIVTNKGLSSNSNSESSSNPDDSEITVKKTTPKEKKFGSLVNIETEIYKGSTNKYSLSAYIEKEGQKISQTTKINLNEKFTNYKVTLPIQLKPNCDLKINEGKAEVIVDGLGEIVSEEIFISGLNKELCKNYLSDTKKLSVNEKEVNKVKDKGQKFGYEIIGLPATISSLEPLNVKVEFTGDKNEHEIKVWSYLYRGSKCYSCCADCESVFERDNNLKKFDLNIDEIKIIELPLDIDEDIAAGEYKIKVKVNKDNQKTDQELTATINLKEPEKIEKKADNLDLTLLPLTQSGKSPEIEGLELFTMKRMIAGNKGVVIYESNAEKAKNLIPILLAITFGLLCLVLIWKKS